ncbi:MAG TPA: hypothetical protein VNV37_11460 [Solirubrobacteraceae bacterium]|nr:hypothetical protein [Solirubrobacteraceae bacterium]
MTERNPFDEPRKPPARTKATVRGPNVRNTIDTPPRPDAVKVLKAAIRKQLHERRPGGGRSDAG